MHPNHSYDECIGRGLDSTPDKLANHTERGEIVRQSLVSLDLTYPIAAIHHLCNAFVLLVVVVPFKNDFLVFQIWIRNAQGDDTTGVVVGKVDTLRRSAAADGE